MGFELLYLLALLHFVSLRSSFSLHPFPHVAGFFQLLLDVFLLGRHLAQFLFLPCEWERRMIEVLDSLVSLHIVSVFSVSSFPLLSLSPPLSPNCNSSTNLVYLPPSISLNYLSVH